MRLGLGGAKLVWAKLNVYIDWGLAVEIVRQARASAALINPPLGPPIFVCN